jgi:hypothetical protein
MSKQLSPKDVNKPRSKNVDTTIIVALIALIGTLGTALFNSPALLEWIKNKPAPTTASSVQVQLPSNSSKPIPAAPVPSLTGGDGNCLMQHFADIEPTRQISIEGGATDQDYYILSQDLAKKDFIGPIGIRLTQNAKMIAAISFIFFTDSHLFKITSLVDSNCQAVANYSNVDRGGDRNSLQDSDTLKIDLTEGSFSLRFIFFGPDRFRFNFQQLQ